MPVNRLLQHSEVVSHLSFACGPLQLDANALCNDQGVSFMMVDCIPDGTSTRGKSSLAYQQDRAQVGTPVFVHTLLKKIAGLTDIVSADVTR